MTINIDAILKWEVSTDVISSAKNSQERIKKLKQKNEELDNQINQFIKDADEYLKTKGKETTGYQFDDYVRELEQLANLQDDEKAKEILATAERLALHRNTVIENYQEKNYLSIYEKWQVEKIAKDLNKIDYKQAFQKLLWVSKDLIDDFSNESLESVIRNYSSIKKVLEKVKLSDKQRSHQVKDFDLSAEDISNDVVESPIKDSLEKAWYIKSGWSLDGWEIKGLKVLVDKLDEWKLKPLQILSLLGVNLREIERSKELINKINSDNIFDWIGDYDGNWLVEWDDKWLLYWQQLTEMLKRYEALNKKQFYKNITDILISIAKTHNLDWWNINIKSRQDLYNFMKQHPEAKYLFIRFYELSNVPDLSKSSEEIQTYVEVSSNIIEKNKNIKEALSILENKLGEKIDKSLKETISKLEKKLPTLKGKEKQQVEQLLQILKSPDLKKTILEKLRPSMMWVIVSLVRWDEWYWFGMWWRKEINKFIDSIDIWIWLFHWKTKANFLPSLVVKANKDIKLWKDGRLTITWWTNFWILEFAWFEIGRRLKTKMKELFDFQDIGEKELSVSWMVSSIKFISTAWWWIALNYRNDVEAWLEKNTERFADFIDEILDLIWKWDIKNNIEALAKKYKIKKEHLRQIVDNIETVKNMPWYKDVDWKILKNQIKQQYISVYRDAMSQYLVNFKDKKVEWWTIWITFILHFFPMPFLIPQINHYKTDYQINKADLLKKASYINYADKNLKSVNDLNLLANKLEATFGKDIKAKIVDNKLILNAVNWKDILDVVNIYVDPSKVNQIKYENGKLTIWNVWKIYATFLAEWDWIANYLFLWTDKVDGTIKLTKEIADSFKDNKPESILKKFTLSEIKEKIWDIATQYFIEKDGRLYIDENRDGKPDVDITNWGYEIIIDSKRVSYRKIDGSVLKIRYLKVDKIDKDWNELLNGKKLEWKMEEMSEIQKIDWMLDSLFEKNWIDFAKLKRDSDYPKFEKAKANNDYVEALDIAISLISKIKWTESLVKELKEISNWWNEILQVYTTDLLDRYFRADVEWLVKIYRKDLIGKALNEIEKLPDTLKLWNVNISKREVKSILIDLKSNNIDKIKKYLINLWFKWKKDSPIAEFFMYLAWTQKDQSIYTNIWKQLALAYSENVSSEIFGEKHNRKRVFKEIFEKNWLDTSIVDKVLGKLEKKLKNGEDVTYTQKGYENVIAFMTVAWIQDTGKEVKSTWKWLHSMAPWLVGAVEGSEVVLENSKDKVIDMIISNSEYANAIRDFMLALLDKAWVDVSDKDSVNFLRDDQLKNLLTNGEIRLNIDWKDLRIDLDRDFIAFAADKCWNVAVGMRLKGITISEIKWPSTILVRTGWIEFGSGWNWVINISSSDVQVRALAFVGGKGEKDRGKNNISSNSEQNENSGKPSWQTNVNIWWWEGTGSWGGSWTGGWDFGG